MNMAVAFNNADFVAMERELASRRLSKFVKMAWPIIEPSTQLKWDWAFDAVCEHLEAVTKGEIKDLLINIPPGMMKSLLVGVFWPAWEWGPKKSAHLRYLSTSHKESLAIRDTMRMRSIIRSDWFQERWPIEFRKDRDSKSSFENTSTGSREAMAFTSMTGSRGDRILVDDPHSVDDANSVAKLEAAAITFTEALPTRKNNEKSATVVVMQRLNERDTSGIIIENEFGFEHLMLPMRYEEERKCRTSIGFVDPRTTDGELLAPNRFPEEEVLKLEKVLSSVGGSYAVAGQLQQRPAPRGGGLIKREWWEGKILDILPAKIKWVRAWDLAASEGPRAAYTAAVKMGLDRDGRFVIADVRRRRVGPGDLERFILSTAKEDGRRVRGSGPQDPGAAGKVQSSALMKLLRGFRYRFTPETGDKLTRALPFAAQVEAGNVYLLRAPWNAEYIKECADFPTGQFKDMVDATSRAFGELINGSGFSWEDAL